MIEIPPIRRQWLVCPYCGAKTVIFDNTCECKGLYVKCTRGCKREFEAKIHEGKQIK